MEQESVSKSQERPVDLSGLAVVRRRRRILWGVIGAYVPVIWVTLRLTGSGRTIAIVFAAWVVLLVAAACHAALAVCPRCGKTFHLHGPTFFPARRCLHCGLPANADGKGPVS